MFVSRHRILMRPIEHLSRLLGSDSSAVAGVASIELAILAPVLVLALIGTADLGLGIYRKMQVEAAAQAGAQSVIANGFSSAAVTAAVVGATPLPNIEATPAPIQFCGCASPTGIASSSCRVPCPGGSNPGTYVTVSAKANYSTLFPYPLFPSTFVLSAQSTVRSQ